jgi:hypothetical protein
MPRRSHLHAVLARRIRAVTTLTRQLVITLEGGATVNAAATRPRPTGAAFVFAHGAGAGMTHLFMAAVADGLAARRIANRASLRLGPSGPPACRDPRGRRGSKGDFAARSAAAIPWHGNSFHDRWTARSARQRRGHEPSAPFCQLRGSGPLPFDSTRLRRSPTLHRDAQDAVAQLGVDGPPGHVAREQASVHGENLHSGLNAVPEAPGSRESPKADAAKVESTDQDHFAVDAPALDHPPAQFTGLIGDGDKAARAAEAVDAIGRLASAAAY